MLNWNRLQNLDRRWTYLLLLVGVALPVFVPIRLPIYAFRDTLGLYQTLERMPPGGRVLLMADWSPGSKGENWPQTEIVIRHMLRRGIPFMIMGRDQIGPGLAHEMAEKIAPEYGRTYGTDWVHLGYKYLDAAQLVSFIQDIPGFVKRDALGTPVERLPLMQGVKNLSAVNLVYVVSATPTVMDWIGLAQPKYKTPVACGVTAVMAPEMYPYFDSGQLAGMLVGMRGAAEYEVKLNAPGQAVDGMALQSMAHLVVLSLILLGNVAYLMGRRSERTEPTS